MTEPRHRLITKRRKSEAQIYLTQQGADRPRPVHAGCRNCGQEYYTSPHRLATIGCLSCGRRTWPGKGGLFKRLESHEGTNE